MSNSLELSSRWLLNNGTQIPVLGFGVWQARPGESTRHAVLHALRVGYRHIDTARLYDNESDVGAAVRESGLPRADVFVTTKLWHSDHGRDSAHAAFDESLKRLGLEYVDLYLIHWPGGGRRIETWKALEEIVKSGRARAIGVSNFTIGHLQELLDAGGVVPAVNQVELSPYLAQRELVEFCQRTGIVVEAYSPLTRARKFSDARLLAIASSHGKTPAQVLLRWALERGVVPLPKSVRPARIEENAALFDFELTDTDRASLADFDEGFRTCWNPEELPDRT